MLCVQLTCKVHVLRLHDNLLPCPALPTTNMEVELSWFYFYKQLLALQSSSTVIVQLYRVQVRTCSWFSEQRPKHAGLVAPPGGAIRSIPAGQISMEIFLHASKSEIELC